MFFGLAFKVPPPAGGGDVETRSAVTPVEC